MKEFVVSLELSMRVVVYFWLAGALSRYALGG
jgi:hypothetical protein